MDKKQEYLNELEYHLSLPHKICNEIINDISERIEDEKKRKPI